MKTILTFVGGGERDEVILRTALAAAAPLSADIDFMHAHVQSSQLAQQSKFGFAPAAVLSSALSKLQAKAKTYSRTAAENVRTFCETEGVALGDAPAGHHDMTATFFEETTNDLETLRSHAARRDLVVIGRARQKQGLTPDILEYLIRKTGRPVLAAGSSAPQSLVGTIVVCWKNERSTAPAVRDAAILLAKARRVVFVSVAKSGKRLSEALSAKAREITGIDAEVLVVPPTRHGIPDSLAQAADECDADLLVMGAYSRSHVGEILFGSCTDHLLARSDRPILLRH